MTHPAFIQIRQQPIDNLKLQFEEYQHVVTGARHIHLASEDNNNVFLVAFLTVPQDSTGVAHILEHTTLCGSERYPVRDPFFMMARRSLNTFMNAFTSSDWTAYPFASQNVKDFDNLLQVYLDCVFFPQLDPMDFAQEGCRLEFEQPDNPESPLVYRGIVYNEMKGAISSPTQVLWDKLSETLFPTITYHYNSGGDIAEIPQLTIEKLRAFHATHYHPSNAIFMTYGNLPAAHHQAYFQDCALARFDKLNVQLQVPPEQRYDAPQTVVSYYPLEDPRTTKRTHIVMSWLLAPLTDVRAVMNATLLAGVLLDNSASPLRHALESTQLGEAPSQFCGFEDSTRETFFSCGLEGSEPAHAEAVEALILQVLQDIVAQGIPTEQVESVLHQMELQQREITGDGFPYGLHLLINLLAPALHGGDPIHQLDLDPVLAELRQDCQDPQFIPQLVQKWLLDNPHRVTLVMAPSAELAQQQFEQEQARLAAQKAALDAAATQQLIEQAHRLKARQAQADDPDVLPKVTCADVPDNVTVPSGQQDRVAGYPVTHFAQGTNGMVYQHIVIELPQLPSELVTLLPIFCDCVTELGCADQTYLQTATRQAAVTGGIQARLSVCNDIDDVHQVKGYLSLSGKALVRHQAQLSELLYDTLLQVRFDELTRLRELISQLRSSIDSSITDRGHHLAMLAASSGMRPVGALFHCWYGFDSIRFIRQLDNQLDNEQVLAAFAAQLAYIQAALIKAPRQFLLVSEAHYQAEIQAHLATCWAQTAPATAGFQPFQVIPVNEQIEAAWLTDTQVFFCAQVYPAVSVAHRDAPALMVLGDFLRNGFLHREIREQGGAYGAGASYDGDSGTFRFFSFRDPYWQETLAAFEQSLQWLQSQAHSEQVLEEAVLGVISRIDRPGSPAGEAIGTFFANLHRRSPEHRQQFRSQVLKVTLADLQRVAMTYLQPDTASTVVLGNNKAAGELADTLGDVWML